MNINSNWLEEAALRAEEVTLKTDVIVQIHVRKEGIEIVARKNSRYMARLCTWKELAKAETDILLPAIDLVLVKIRCEHTIS